MMPEMDVVNLDAVNLDDVVNLDQGCGEASPPPRSRFRNALRAGAFWKRSETRSRKRFMRGARFRTC